MPKRTRVSSPAVAEPAPGLWSNCIRVGEAVYVSGMTSRANDGVTIQGKDEYEQAKVIFAKIKHLVEAAGGAMGDVVKITICVTDIGKNAEVWRARKEVFTGDFPASTLVEVSALARPEILVEIEAVAYIGSSR
jgi:2-iminobutanoate/2-iminopropanoate deaminase